MAGASRDTAVFNALYTSTIEKWMGGGRVEDVVFNANQLVWLLSRIAKDTGKFGFNIVQPLMTTRNTGVGWFEYDDSLSIDSMPGPEAAKFDLAFLGGPIVITEQEEIENSEEYRLVNILKFKFDQLLLSMAEELNTAGWKGSGLNAKSIDGIEDIVFAGTPSAGTYPDLSRANVASGVDNTYGGIARTGTTGWENYAWDLGASGLNDAAEDGFTTFTTKAYKCLESAYVLLSRGAIRPDLIVSSLAPYLDLLRLMAANTTYERSVDTFRGIQLGSDNLKFRNAVWLYDEAAVSHSAAGNDATAGDQMIYLFNSNFLKMPVEEGYDFARPKFQSPVDARVSIGHVLWRGQVLSPNPRYHGVIFSYNP